MDDERRGQMSLRPEGVYVALLTPMTEAGELNLDELERQTARMVGSGASGVFVLGTNGEFYALEYGEKVEVIRAARRAAPPGVVVCAGVGCVTTSETVRLAEAAASAGVDAVAVITPHFAALNQGQLLRHFTTVADAAGVPVILYNIPSRTGNVIEPQTAAALCERPNVVGIKDSSGSIESLDTFINSLPSHSSVLVGSDSLILEALDHGASGCVSGMANLVPELVVEIYRSWRTSDHKAALTAQARLDRIRSIVTLGNANSVVKRAVALSGQPVGPCREPASIRDPAVDAEIRAVLIRDGVMTG